MAKIVRKLMKMFGQNAGTNELAQFGSLAAAAPVYVNDGNPDTIQGLTAWQGGWYDAVIGGNSPAIQDMNALQYVYAYQLCYLFQAGVSEYSSTTTYYIGSMVSDGDHLIYASLTDSNTGNALTDVTKWKAINAAVMTTSVVSPRTIVAADNGAILEVDTTSAAVTILLPASVPAQSSGFRFSIIDKGGNLSVNPVTIDRNGSGANIVGLASNYLCEADYGFWTFNCDGTNWWIGER